MNSLCSFFFFLLREYCQSSISFFSSRSDDIPVEFIFSIMSNHPISVSEPLNIENIENSELSHENTSPRLTTWNRMIKIFFYLFSDCLFARILAFTFICQAAVMWLGTALNFILQLLFIPFSFSASSKQGASPSSNILSFLGSYSMVPGIVAFSAHYFWFVLQIGCHCFTTTLRMSQVRLD